MNCRTACRSKTRSRLTTTLVFWLGFLALTAAIWAFRREVYEGWFLWRFASTDTQVRNAAAAELAALGSLRSVPPLIDSIAGDDREQIWWHLPAGAHRIEDFRRNHPGEVLKVTLTPLYHALYRLGPAAEPSIYDWVLQLRKSRDPQKVNRGFDLECQLDFLRAIWEAPYTFSVTRVKYLSP